MTPESLAQTSNDSYVTHLHYSRHVFPWSCPTVGNREPNPFAGWKSTITHDPATQDWVGGTQMDGMGPPLTDVPIMTWEMGSEGVPGCQIEKGGVSTNKLLAKY